jgi:hypothetical protein
MTDNIDEVTDKRLESLKETERDKVTLAKTYIKKVKLNSFHMGNLV